MSRRISRWIFFSSSLDHARPDNVFQFEITADILHPAIIAVHQGEGAEGDVPF